MLEGVKALLTPHFAQAQHLWEQGLYWEVHEALEPLWLQLTSDDREFTHSVILLAAALHKAKTSPSGGWRNFAKAQKHAALLPPSQLALLQPLVNEVQQALQQPGYTPQFTLERVSP